jgi:hypothetical protein
MNHFRAFEVEALRLLGTKTLGDAVVEAVTRESTFVSYNHSGSGYFLTVHHPLLPKVRIVLSEPILLGRVGEVIGTYLAFVENSELVLEYAGFTDVPANIRELHVHIQVQPSAT